METFRRTIRIALIGGAMAIDADADGLYDTTT